MTTALILLALIAAFLLLGRWARHDDLSARGRVAWFD